MSRRDPIPALKQQLGDELARLLVGWTPTTSACWSALIGRASRNYAAEPTVSRSRHWFAISRACGIASTSVSRANQLCAREWGASRLLT